MKGLNKEQVTDELEEKVLKLEEELEEYKQKYQSLLDKYNVYCVIW